VIGETFNITDGRLVSKHEFFGTIADLAGLPPPTRHIPLWLGKALAVGMEWLWKVTNQMEPPLLSTARIKILGLNLDFSIAKARRMLGYDPQLDFREAMQITMDWFRRQRDDGAVAN
jgi:nucleoside-diphosphate-sugar epimerase